jgi:N-acetylglucosaminyl-diphospho-decaprenol L-rhamnosyltransferase
MSAAPDVAVIVVNFNASALARRCLESAAADLGPRHWTAIVVDNASSDGGVEALGALPRTAVITNAVNAGFGAAVNQAVTRTAAPWLWVLNPDCVVHAGAFVALAATLEAHPDCAIAAPQLLNADGSVQASARGNPTAWTGLFGRNTLLTRIFPSAAVARRNLPASDLVASGVESAPVDWVMGAAMLIRREMFDAVGGFDEGYFLYWEDADLCRRLWQRGCSTRYVPRARVAHDGGASARSDSPLATRAFHQSAYRYYATHVVPSPWHPMHWIARAALSGRAAWRIARNRTPGS